MEILLPYLIALLVLLTMPFNYHYKNQHFIHGDELIIKDGRHPVIERSLPIGETYISNDLELNKNRTADHHSYRAKYERGKVCLASSNSFDNINGSYRKFCSG